MLACLKYNQQICEFVTILRMNELISWVLVIALLPKLLQDPENNLRVDSSHPECLHERS